MALAADLCADRPRPSRRADLPKVAASLLGLLACLVALGPDKQRFVPAILANLPRRNTRLLSQPIGHKTAQQALSLAHLVAATPIVMPRASGTAPLLCHCTVCVTHQRGQRVLWGIVTDKKWQGGTRWSAELFGIATVAACWWEQLKTGDTRSIKTAHRKLTVDQRVVQWFVGVEFVFRAQPSKLVACEHRLPDCLSCVLTATMHEAASENQPGPCTTT
jgi:hypothetical protein